MLKAKQIQLLAALLEYPTVRKACAACTIPERTAYRWLANGPFQAVYQKQLQALSQAGMEHILRLRLAEIEQAARRNR